MIESHRKFALCFLLLVSLLTSDSPLFANQDDSSSNIDARLTADSDDKKDSGDKEKSPPSWRGDFRSLMLDSQPESAERAWETRPYQVAVWICFDGSPAITQIEDQICNQIELNCQLLDPCGWRVNTGTPPSQWRWRLLNTKLDDSTIAAILAEDELQFYDKLMIIKVRSESGAVKISAQDLDVKTRQPGAIVSGTTRLPVTVANLATRLMSRAFMPIARIDNINPNNEAFLRARGIESSIRTEINEQLEPEVVKIKSSPCFVRETDKFLPVEVRVDRKGNLERLNAVPFSFIAIENIDGNSIVGKLHSSQRAILTGRKSKRAEKLGLVIRPPQQDTVLRLMSRGTDSPQPLEGYEIHSRRPEDPKDVLNFIGKTDWQGEITIPSGDGLYLLLVRRGSKNLKKIPIIPGFRDFLETTVTSDESRLMAEGVITGLRNEILSLVVLRELYEKEINDAIDDGKIDEARKILRRYTDLEDPTELKTRMSDELIRLKGQAAGEREVKSIQTLFNNLFAIVNSDFVRSKEAEFRKRMEGKSSP